MNNSIQPLDQTPSLGIVISFEPHDKQTQLQAEILHLFNPKNSLAAAKSAHPRGERTFGGLMVAGSTLLPASLVQADMYAVGQCHERCSLRNTAEGCELDH
jgi:hypothetical protein